jgi:hypothetical protein
MFPVLLFFIGTPLSMYLVGKFLDYLDESFNQPVRLKHHTMSAKDRQNIRDLHYPVYNGVYYDDFSHLEHIWPGMEKMNKDPLFRKVAEESQHQRKIDSGIIPGKKSNAIKIREQVYGITYHKNDPSNKYNR